MATFQGKSGADAIFKSIKHVCNVDRKYHTKMVAAIELAALASLISSDQATQAVSLLDNITSFCTTFEKVAGNSGFGSG